MSAADPGDILYKKLNLPPCPKSLHSLVHTFIQATAAVFGLSAFLETSTHPGTVHGDLHLGNILWHEKRQRWIVID